ncbi:cingulin-like [Macrobrachium nipponense]|uniref:cingulin-like n=1 Tax=Macrobrachium nipponense TaxID=159736 RepID=UPI0030C8D36D
MTGTRTSDKRRSADKIKVVEMSPPTAVIGEGLEVPDEVFIHLKNDLDEAFGRNRELLDKNIKLVEMEGALRRRVDELQKLLIQQEVDHHHQLAVLREEANANARAVEDQASKMEYLWRKSENTNRALRWKEIEINHLKQEISRKTEKLASDEKQMLAMQEKVSGMEDENSRLQSQIETLKSRVSEQDEANSRVVEDQASKIEDLRRKNENANSALRWKEIEINHLKNSITQKTAKLASGEKEILAMQEKVSGMEDENSRLQSQIETLKSRVSEQDEANARVVEDQASKIEDLRRKNENANSALRWKEIEINHLKNGITQKTAKLASDEKEILAMQEKVSGMENENSRLQSQIETLKSRVSEQDEANARAAEDQASKIEDLRRKNENANSALRWKEIEINHLKNDIAQKTAKLASDEKEILAMQEKVSGVKDENSRLQSQIETLKSRIFEQEKDCNENAETKQETKEGLKTREERRIR